MLPVREMGFITRFRVASITIANPDRKFWALLVTPIAPIARLATLQAFTIRLLTLTTGTLS